MPEPLQGDVYYISLPPNQSVGSEQHGNRPAVIISNDTMNQNMDTVIVCMVSTSVRDPGSWAVILEAGYPVREQSIVKLFQIRTVSKSRLLNKVGSIPHSKLEEIRAKLPNLM